MRFRSRLISAIKKQSIMKQVAFLAVPLMLQNLSFTLLGVADTFFVSKVSTEAVAAVGLAGVMFYAVALLFRTAGTSAVVFVGRAHGSGDDDRLGEAVWHVLNMVFYLSIISLVLPWVFSWLYSFAAADEVVRGLGSSYLQIRAYEIPFMMFSAVVWGFMLGRNDSTTPMILAWIQVLVNIFLDWIMVLGNFGFPALGVDGAAYATVISNVLNALLSAWLLWRPKFIKQYSMNKFRIANWTQLSKILKISLPMGMGEFVSISAFTVFFSMIGRLDTAALAANNIAIQYMSLAFTLGIAIEMAASSLVSQYLGKKDPDKATQVAYRSVFLAIVSMGLVGATFLIAPAKLISVFSAEAAVITAGVTILKLVALYQIIDAVGIVLGGVLNGAGDTTFTMWYRIIIAVFIFMPLEWLIIFRLDGGIFAAWLGALTYLTLLSVGYFLRFRHGYWKTIEVS